MHQSWLMHAYHAESNSRGTGQPLAILRYWQWLDARETTVAHHDHDIEDLEKLTCHHIGFDRQSHYTY